MHKELPYVSDPPHVAKKQHRFGRAPAAQCAVSYGSTTIVFWPNHESPAMSLRLLLLSLFLTISVTAEEPPSAPVARPVAHRRTGDERPSGDRQREGTKVTDISGRFEIAGDRVTFFPVGGRESFRLLENLALERVAQVLSETRARQEWTISGTLTEFRGANYLLLTKAVIKSTAETK